jgi:hypothetical protein
MWIRIRIRNTAFKSVSICERLPINQLKKLGRCRYQCKQYTRARICKPFKEPRNRFPAWRAGTTTLFLYWPAMLHRLAESNPRNRFLVSLNFYKYGLCKLFPAICETILLQSVALTVRLTGF